MHLNFNTAFDPTKWPNGIVPSYTSDIDVENRVLTLQFGDGYSQRSPDGLNPRKENWKLVFKNRSRADIQELCKFLDGLDPYERLPSEYFFWTPPTIPHNYQKKYTATKYTLAWVSLDIGTLSVTFEQSFEV